MSKYYLNWDESKLEKYIKEGRGSGKGQDYKPWVTIHDFPSQGISSRSTGWKSNRVGHFLSLNELRCFHLFNWADHIIDIREQFPLIDLNETIKIAEDLGIKHPMDPQSKTPYVLTTDFMLTLKIEGKEVEVARTVKPAKYLENARVLEKYEIEKRYWAARGVNWKVITEEDISVTFSDNVSWVHTEYWLESSHQLGISELIEIGEVLKQRLAASENKIVYVTNKLDKEMNLEVGTSLYILKHLIARKQIITDMNVKLSTAMPASSFTRIIRRDGKTIAG